MSEEYGLNDEDSRDANTAGATNICDATSSCDATSCDATSYDATGTTVI